MNKKYQVIMMIFILMLFSLINTYSAGLIMSTYQNFFMKEFIWYGIGFLILTLASKININVFFRYSFWLYLFGNLLLLITLFAGSKVNGSMSWLYIGPFGMQPSEFMKIFLIIYLYSWTKRTNLNDFKYIIVSLLIVLLPSILTFLEPDTGAVIIYLVIYLAFLIIRGLNKWWYIAVGGILLVSIGIFFWLYYGYQNTFINIFGTSFFYRMDRVTNFLKGEGYQISKALTAIGSSGLWGRGLKVAPEYFPEAPTDFAFALLINNIGLFGIILFLLSYALLFIFLIRMMNKKNKHLLLPIIMVLFTQFSINVLMNIGLFPIIGITLPFISYGGSSLLSYFLLIALVLNNKKVSIDT